MPKSMRFARFEGGLDRKKQGPNDEEGKISRGAPGRYDLAFKMEEVRLWKSSGWAPERVRSGAGDQRV
jgi:hypothetical protein